MSDVEEQSLSQVGEFDQSSQKTDQADAFELHPRPWYVV
jgi:amino acid transporter